MSSKHIPAVISSCRASCACSYAESLSLFRFRYHAPRNIGRDQVIKSPHRTFNTQARRFASRPVEAVPSSQRSRLEQSSGLVTALAKQLRKRATKTTETYVAYGACEMLVKECARQADYTVAEPKKTNVDIPKSEKGEDICIGHGWWYEQLGLPPTFNTWAHVTFIHMYVLNCRLRMLPTKLAPIWHQHLLDHFFFMAEDRMNTRHGIVAASARNKYLKDLYLQWRGILTSYDEGLMRGDAVLATAVWRNLFNADPNTDMQGVAQVIGYMRGVLQGLEDIGDDGVVGGDIAFGDPSQIEI